MNRIRNTKIIIGLVLIFFFAREVLPFDISIYKSYSDLSASIDSELKEYSYPFRIHKHQDEKKFFDTNNPTTPTIKFYYFENESLPEYSENNSDEIKVFIEKNRDIGNGIYIPFIKSIDFSCNIRYHWDSKFKKNDTVHSFKSSGSLDVDGTKRIFGICSTKKATQLIEQVISKEIEKNVTAKIKEDIKDFTQ